MRENGGEDDERGDAAHQGDGEEVAGRSRRGEGAAHQAPDIGDDLLYPAALAEDLGDADPAEDDDPEDGEDPAGAARDCRNERLRRHAGKKAEENGRPDKGEERREAMPERRDGDRHKGDGEGDEGLHQSLVRGSGI
nr:MULTISPECIES: hypothetical protein [unclassified Methanoculleus]